MKAKLMSLCQDSRNHKQTVRPTTQMSTNKNSRTRRSVKRDRPDAEYAIPISKQKMAEVNLSSYQPSTAELEADVSIPTTPDELIKAVINYNPKKEN